MTKEKTNSSNFKDKLTKYNIFYTIFVLAWAIFATIASQYVVVYPMIFILGAEKFQQPLWTLVYYIIVYAITIPLVILVPPALLKVYHKNHPHVDKKNIDQVEQDIKSNTTSMGIHKPPTFVDLGLAPIGYAIYIFLSGVIVSFMKQFTWYDAEQAQDVGFGYYVTGLDRLFAIIAIVVIAPIAEEIVMRGWLYGKVRRKWAAPIAALLVSIVFGVMHGQLNVGISTFCLSIVLCSLREITGTIWSGILLHMLTNGIAFYILYIAI